jgi:hypothetical protein
LAWTGSRDWQQGLALALPLAARCGKLAIWTDIPSSIAASVVDFARATSPGMVMASPASSPGSSVIMALAPGATADAAAPHWPQLGMNALAWAFVLAPPPAVPVGG